ncbi:retrovirus-related pol polyprotein from transposon TNT 1-94 [Tanacetum coccineum]
MYVNHQESEDPDFPDRVYKVEKALYRLHQAPRAWYETLSTYLLDNGFQRGKIDKTLFIKRHKEVWTASTPMETQKPLLKDEDGKEVDVHMYRLMIGSLMYLTSSIPDIMFAVCARVRYQVNPKCKKQTIVVNSTTEAEYVVASSCCRQVLWIQNQLLDYRRDLQLEDAEGVDCLPNSTIFEQLTLMGSKTTSWNEFSNTMASVVICLATIQKFNFSKYIFENEAVHKELGDSLVRAATTASSLEIEQENGNITKTRSKATPNESSSLGTSSGGGPKCQETMGDTTARTRFESVSKHSNYSLLTRGNTPRSDEDKLKLEELMALCTNLQKKILDLEQTKTTQQIEIDSLKRRVKKLEKKRSSRTHKLKRLYKVDEDITLVNAQDDADNEMFDVGTLTALKSVKPKVKGDVIEEPSVPVSAASASIMAKVQDKGKGKMVEPEPVKKMSKKDQLRSDEEEAKRIQAEFDEEERLAREKDDVGPTSIDRIP